MEREREVVLEAREVSISYGEKTIVDAVSLELSAGEVLVLLGPSGCGKSTLLKALIGLIVPDTGRIEIDGRNIVGLDEDGMVPVRREMGVCFQGGALFSSLTLTENVALPILEGTDSTEEEAHWVADMKLAMVGLSDARDKLPAELSGGMRKRAAIARSLALDPRILFLDEPTSGLDPITAAGIDELVLTLKSAFGVAVFAVTHDVDSAFRIADRMAIMSAGKLLSVQSPDDMRRDEDPRIEGFLNRRPPHEDEEGGRGSGFARYLEPAGGRGG